MPVGLVKSTAASVALTPDERAVSATFSFVDPGNNEKASGSGSLDTASTTVAEIGTSPDVLTVASSSGFEVWGQYWYVSQDGWGAKVRVSEINGNVITLLASPPGTPRVGDTLQGLTFTAAVSASVLGTAGKFYRFDWVVTDAEGAKRSYRQMAHVVAMAFRDPTTPDDVSRIAQQSHPSWARTQTYGTWRSVSDRANQRIRRILTAAKNYPSLIGDHEALSDAGEVAIRLELAIMGRVPAGNDASTYVNETKRALKGDVLEAIAGMWVDRDEDQTVGRKETVGINSINIERY